MAKTKGGAAKDGGSLADKVATELAKKKSS